MAAFLVMPLRGVLYTLSDNHFWLVAVQTLDGVGSGIYGAVFPIIVSDLMRRTGRASTPRRCDHDGAGNWRRAFNHVRGICGGACGLQRRFPAARRGGGELANLYGAVLTLGTAPIGGLRAELALPAG